MAIEINNRTKILAGVVVLLAAAAGAWFFLFEADAPPPKPAASAPKPAADAAKAPAKAAEPGKAAEAPKTADAAKAGDAAKPAAAAPKPAAAAAKPIPTNPDQLVAEVIEASGLKAQFKSIGEEAARDAVSGGRDTAISPEDLRAIADAMQRIFEPGAMTAEVAAKLKSGLDAERMARFLEILREPVSLKMTREELRKVEPEQLKAFNEKIRKEPLPAARVKLIQTIDGVTRNSEVGADLFSAMVNAMLDAVFAELKKAGKAVPADARRSLATQLNAVRSQARSRILGLMYFQYRDVSEEDLAAYVKLVDTDTGRWGGEQLVNAARPVLVDRFGAAGKDIAKIVIASRGAMAKKAPEPAPEPLAKAQPETAAAPAAAPAAPAEPVGYQRPANLRDLYSRYNDLITATVMRDRAAVKELLDDGKTPNVRQADGSTPLMIAAGNNDAEIASMLLAKGADPNLRASGGATALSAARSRGQAGAGMVQLLQRAGAKD